MDYYKYHIIDFYETVNGKRYHFKMLKYVGPDSECALLSKQNLMGFDVFIGQTTKRMITSNTMGTVTGSVKAIRKAIRAQILMIAFFDQVDWKGMNRLA